MAVPLLEPGLLVTDNCTACRGTGRLADEETVCGDCGGSGREVTEMPLAQAFERAQAQAQALVAPTPTMARAAALAEVDEGETDGEPGT